MPSFYVVRLGPDSVADIKRLDAPGASATTPFSIDVICKQVPNGVAAGDFALIWLGSDNNKGGATSWTQGLRALGEITGVAGGPSWKDIKTVSISVGVILDTSISKSDVIEQTHVPYRELFNVPVLGSNNYASQVVQKIEPLQRGQNLSALLHTIELLRPGFRATAIAAYPLVTPFFGSIIPVGGATSAASTTEGSAASLPTAGSWDIPMSSLGSLDGLVGMEEAALRAMSALRSGMHVIFTGPPGTGKTKLAECLCRSAGFSSWTVPATDQWTTFETIGGYFPTPSEEDTTTGSSGSDRLDFLPGAVVDAISRGNCLIVDEINRADIDKAFGELFTLLAGNSVTLPYRRRTAEGFFRVRLQVDNAPPEKEIDIIPIPTWWRMIGAMNDADKASLKRLSLAFIRRFAFVPVTIPSKDVYEGLLKSRFSALSPVPTGPVLMQVLDTIVGLFCDSTAGFAEIGMPFGPAIPLAMLRQALTEATAEPARSHDQMLASILQLYVAPQFQGRADKHEQCSEIFQTAIQDKTLAQSSVETLAIWTGYDG